MAEITSKDSKLFTCYMRLTDIDVYNLDFSKLYYIDGVLFRLVKVEGYNPLEFGLAKVTLLKAIDSSYAFISGGTGGGETGGGTGGSGGTGGGWIIIEEDDPGGGGVGGGGGEGGGGTGSGGGLGGDIFA